MTEDEVVEVRAGRAVLDVMMTAEKPSDALTIGHAADLHEALKLFTEVPDAE